MSEDRRSPLVAQLVLLVAFLAIAVAGVVTVLVPELSDDEGEEQEQSATEEAAEATTTEPD